MLYDKILFLLIYTTILPNCSMVFVFPLYKGHLFVQLYLKCAFREMTNFSHID